MQKNKETIQLLLVALIGGVLHGLAFPGPIASNGIWPFIFISAGFMFYIADKSTWKNIFICGPIYIFIFFMLSTYWLGSFSPGSIFLIPIGEAIRYLIFFTLIKSLTYIFPKRYYLFQSLVYIVFLYWTHNVFLNNPYGDISAPLINAPILVQSSDIWGSWGICLLLILPQSLIAEILADHHSFKEFKMDFMFIIIVHILNVGYGIWAMNFWKEKPSESVIKTGVYQLYRESKQTEEVLQEEVSRIIKNTEPHIKDNELELLVMNEGVLSEAEWMVKYPIIFGWPEMTNRQDIARKFIERTVYWNAPCIIGSNEWVIKDSNLPPYDEEFNINKVNKTSALLINEGEIIDIYDKQFLIPFVEKQPEHLKFPGFTQYIERTFIDLNNGTEHHALSINGMKIGPLICTEDMLGVIAAEMCQQDVDILAVVSSESWSKDVSSLENHLQLARFRSIENRKTIIRSCRNGISCMILPTGEVVDPIDFQQEMFKIYEAPVYSRNHTFFTDHPLLLVELSSFVLMCSLWIRFCQEMRRRYFERGLR